MDIFPEGHETPQMDYYSGFDTPEPTMEAFEHDPQRAMEAQRFCSEFGSVRCAEGDHIVLGARLARFPKPLSKYRTLRTVQTVKDSWSSKYIGNVEFKRIPDQVPTVGIVNEESQK